MFLLLSTPRDSFRLYILDKIIIITIRVRVIRVFHLKDMKNWRFTSSGKNRTTGVYTGLPVVLLSLRKLTGVSPDYRCSRSDYRLGLVSWFLLSCLTWSLDLEVLEISFKEGSDLTLVYTSIFCDLGLDELWLLCLVSMLGGCLVSIRCYYETYDSFYLEVLLFEHRRRAWCHSFFQWRLWLWDCYSLLCLEMCGLEDESELASSFILEICGNFKRSFGS